MNPRIKAVAQLLRIENPPERSRRRVRQLLRELEQERSHIALLEIQKNKVQEDYNRMEDTVRDLLVNEVHLRDQIADLENRLQMAIDAAWTNEQRVSFAMFDAADPHVSDATEAIDVAQLRHDWAKEPLTGKVTQRNPATGRHETVEVNTADVAAFATAKPIEITLLPPGVGSVSPTHIPGMALVS